MIDQWWILLLVGWGAVATSMLGLWAYATAVRDASVVDAGWGYALALCGALYAIVADGAPEHRAVIGLLAGLTGLKIGTYVLVGRVIGKDEDGRYRTLREKWGARATRRFFVFFQAQGLLAVVLSVPFVAAALNPDPGLEPVELAGVAVWAAGTLGETEADRELNAFKRDPANRGKVMDRDLWAASRHPNYFFQIVTWCGFALVATAAPWGWVGWMASILIALSILFVTGIPPTEAQSVKSRGDAYRDYQRRVRPLVPWFPKRGSA